MASWLGLLPHTNKAQNSNPPPNLGLSLWGLHFSLTFQLHGSITHLRTDASITHFNIWSFMTPNELQKILCFKAEAASLLGSQITDEYDYSKLCFHKAISVLTPDQFFSRFNKKMWALNNAVNTALWSYSFFWNVLMCCTNVWQRMLPLPLIIHGGFMYRFMHVKHEMSKLIPNCHREADPQRVSCYQESNRGHCVPRLNL